MLRYNSFQSRAIKKNMNNRKRSGKRLKNIKYGWQCYVTIESTICADNDKNKDDESWREKRERAWTGGSTFAETSLPSVVKSTISPVYILSRIVRSTNRTNQVKSGRIRARWSPRQQWRLTRRSLGVAGFWRILLAHQFPPSNLTWSNFDLT